MSPDASDLHEQRYRAVLARDRRFDGTFFTAVRTTGIFCRPSCPAITPRRENVEFHRTSASAQSAGFRACKRCRPDASPGSPEWDVRADVVARAIRLIRDGAVDRDGVTGLADRLGYSERQLHRLLVDEVGAGPLALARAERLRIARVLVETTAMPVTDIAFAAGFGSIRQFNDSFRTAFAVAPRELRSAGSEGAGDVVTLRLAVRTPYAADALADFLDDHAVARLERADGRLFARTLTLPHGPGVVELTLHDDHVVCRLQVADVRDTAPAVSRVRRLLDLDADPVAIDRALAEDSALRGLVTAEPGLRVPGSVDADETLLRTVVGQQISVSGARTVIGRIVADHGAAVDLSLAREHGLDRLFPSADLLASLDPESLPMPRSRGRTVVGTAAALAGGALRLDPGSDRSEARASMLALRGIGPWTADYVLMRGLGDPDVLLTTDLVLRRELEARGVDASDTRRWAPWRSYAGMHLWRAVTRPDEESS